MRDNPFGHIHKLCHQVGDKPKLEFPRMVDIEVTNQCNFNCAMCPVGNGTMKRKRGLMTGDVFHKTLRELVIRRTPIRFIRWGEPLLHPRLLEFVEVAVDAGMMCHINTNGFFVDDDFIRRIIKIPLDSIKFSFQGVDANGYKAMRGQDFFDGLVATIKKLYLYRGRKKSPYINVGTTVTNETKEQINAFKERMRQFADKVWVSETADLKTCNKQHLAHCPEVFDKLSVNWDGTVSACCGDWDNMMLAGDIKEQTLAEIWNGEKMNYYRQMLTDMRHSELELCKRCARSK